MKEKALALQKHLIAVMNQLSNPSKRHSAARIAAYKEWAQLEIKRTKSAIEKANS